MKKFFTLSLAFLAVVFVNFNVAAEDWYFATSENSWATTDDTKFAATDETDVYVLKSYTSIGGFNFKVTNSDWSTQYGWAENVTAVDQEFALALGAGNGWVALDGATYDVYFYAAKPAIKFVKSSDQEDVDEGSVWYFTGDFNSWSLADDVLFAATDDANVFELKNFAIPISSISDGVWTFLVCTANWGVGYIYETAIAEEGTYQLTKRSDNSSATSSISEGTYDLTWNKSTHQLTFKKVESTAISSVADDENLAAEYFDLTGRKISSDDLGSGLYIEKKGGKAELIRVR